MVGVVRLIGVLIALYVVTSMIMLVRDRRWLTGFGALSTEAHDRKDLQTRLVEADSRYATLESEYNAIVELLTRAVGSMPDPEIKAEEASP